MSTIFPAPDRHSDNSVAGELKARRKALVLHVRELPDSRLMRPELEAEIIDGLLEDHTYEPLELGVHFTEAVNERTIVPETNPMYAGSPHGTQRRRHVEVFVVRVPLVSGSPSWLYHRPAGALPLLSNATTYDRARHAIVIRIFDDHRDDPQGVQARRHLESELTTIGRYVDATNAEIDAWNTEFPDVCRALISAERGRRSEVDQRKRALGPPVAATSSAPIPYPLPRRRRPRVRLDPDEARELGGRSYLPVQDYADVLNELQRSAQFLAEHPAVYTLDENGMRDIVLSQLNAAFPAGATGETFSNRGKTDIRVVTATAVTSGSGDCVFKAECKVWDGPAASRDAVDQLCDRYLVHADTRSAIVLFAKPPYLRKDVTLQAITELETSFAATRLPDIAGWPVMRVSHPALPTPVDVAIITT